MSSSDYSSGMQSQKAQSYNNSRKTTEAASINSGYEFNNINKEIKNIHSISAKIDKAKTEKDISDLNARLVAEVAYLQAEQIRMEAIINKQLASSAANSLAGASIEAESTSEENNQ